MRTQATHKVILNAPIFKEMSITAGKGSEPSGKQAMISIPIEGKVVPHMIKVCFAVPFLVLPDYLWFVY
jgi:hypothetical protein